VAVQQLDAATSETGGIRTPEGDEQALGRVAEDLRWDIEELVAQRRVASAPRDVVRSVEVHVVQGVDHPVGEAGTRAEVLDVHD
jgi:hypothetical protein